MSTSIANPPAAGQAAEITEAQVVAFLRSHAQGILARYPQVDDVSMHVQVFAMKRREGWSSATMHLGGPGFRECAIEDDLVTAERVAAASIETPEKVLAKAREAVAKAAADLALLEGRAPAA